MLGSGENPVKSVDNDSIRLAAVIESSEDAIITHAPDGRIESWNRAATRMFGYTAADALGRPIDLIIPPDRRTEDAEIIKRLRQGEVVSHFETFGLVRTGAYVPISLTMSPVLSQAGDVVAISRIARNISRQKALEQQAFRLAAIVESSEDAIASKDLNGIVQTWNKAAERMFGYSAADIIGRPISLIIPADREGEEAHVLASIRAGLSIEHFETVRRRKDGSFIDISLSVSPIRTSSGAIIGASKIARDITAQRLLARQAEEAGRVKDDFLAMLSHELRTPLNAVLGYTRMLRVGDFGDDRRERTIEIIERNAKILSQLVSDVLDVSTIVTGKIRLRLGPCDIAGVLGAAVDVVRPSAAAKGVSLHVSAPPEGAPGQCDGDRMQQVFWNLLSNAVKFTPRGGRVSVDLVRLDESVRITVTDTGVGIRADALPHLFQRFWQGEGLRQPGSLGLGLALARHFVELHGGTIAASSAGEGQGAVFTVVLPVTQSP
jgi:PAS domain S-box-containing protein